MNISSRANYALMMGKIRQGLDQSEVDVWCNIADLPRSYEKTFRNACELLEQNGRLGVDNLTLLVNALDSWGRRDLLQIIEKYQSTQLVQPAQLVQPFLQPAQSFANKEPIISLRVLATKCHPLIIRHFKSVMQHQEKHEEFTNYLKSAVNDDNEYILQAVDSEFDDKLMDCDDNDIYAFLNLWFTEFKTKAETPDKLYMSTLKAFKVLFGLLNNEITNDEFIDPEIEKIIQFREERKKMLESQNTHKGIPKPALKLNNPQSSFKR